MTNMSYSLPCTTSTYCSAGKSAYSTDAARDKAALPETVSKSLGILTQSYGGGYNSMSMTAPILPSYFAAPSGKADYSGTSPPQHITTPLKPGDIDSSIVLKGSRPNI